MRIPWGAPTVSDPTKLEPLRPLAMASAAGERLYQLALQLASFNDFSVDFGELTEVDSGANVSVAGGVLLVNGSAAWNANGVRSPLTSRSAHPGKISIKFYLDDNGLFMLGPQGGGALLHTDTSPHYFWNGPGNLSYQYSHVGGPILGLPAMPVDTWRTMVFEWDKNGVIAASVDGELLFANRTFYANDNIGLQVNVFTTTANPMRYDDYYRYMDYPTDGPTLTYVADAGASKLFNGFVPTNLAAVGSWATTNAKFQYSYDDGTPAYNGSWLTLAQLQAVSALTTSKRYIRLMVQANSDGATQQYVGELNADDAITVLPAITEVVPTGLAIADRGDGSGGLATITNIDDLPAGTLIIVCATDGTTVIGSGTKEEYTANSGIICPNVTLDAERTGDKAKATSDLYVESEWSAAAAAWTPTASTAPADPATVTAARVSETTIRLTVSGAAGTTVRPYYSTVAAAGSPWTAGETRSGNGTVDITVLAGTEYYLFVVVDNGTYSIPSNIIRMSTAVGSSGVLIASFGFPKLRSQPKVLVDTLDEQRIQAQYLLGAKTIAAAELLVGNYLPADSTHGITGSTWEIVNSRERKVPKSEMKMAEVVARVVRLFEDSFS